MAPTATPEQQQVLLDLQDLDTALLQSARKRAELPLIAQVRELEVELGAIDYRIVAAKTEVADKTVALRKAEADVEQVVSRVERDQQRMDSGSASAKELEGLQHELGSLAARRAELEDVELEVMQGLEDAKDALDGLENDRMRVDNALVQARDNLASEIDELDKADAHTQAKRDEIATQVPVELVALYDKLRVDLGGVGAALLQRGACQGCHISIDASELSRIRTAAPTDVVRCPECRRILVRTAESGL